MKNIHGKVRGTYLKPIKYDGEDFMKNELRNAKKVDKCVTVPPTLILQ